MSLFNKTAVMAASVAALVLISSNAFAGGGGGPGGGGGGGKPGGGGNKPKGGAMGFQSTKIVQEDPTVTADRNAVNDATHDFNSAITSYNTYLSIFETGLRQKPDYLAAKKTLDEALREQDGVRKSILSKLKGSNPEYKTALRKEASPKDHLEELRDDGAPKASIGKQSNVILDISNTVSKLEISALDSDASYASIKKKVSEAKSTLDTLDRGITDASKKNDSIIKLAKAKEDAQVTLDKARAKLTADMNKPKPNPGGGNPGGGFGGPGGGGPGGGYGGPGGGGPGGGYGGPGGGGGGPGGGGNWGGGGGGGF